LKRTFKVYAVQLPYAQCRFQENYNLALTFLNLCERGSLVVFPELFLTGFCYERVKEAVEFSERACQELLAFSRGLELTMVFTTLELINGKLFNSVKVFDRGEELLSRPKVKLFKPTGEQLHFEEGKESELKTVETSCGILAPVICFELRFFPILQKLKEQKGELFTVCAQWGRARREHWELLTKARAVELQRFVAASNGCGREMAGSSAIVDPWGRTLAEAKDAVGFVSARVNLSVIAQVEKKLPLN
jgi:predicted amidohydrolase